MKVGFDNQKYLTMQSQQIRRRIGHAQTLLISTSYTVTQIASLVGYDNTNYFSTQFSKVVGMSPTHYRTFYSEEAKGQQDQF